MAVKIYLLCNLIKQYIYVYISRHLKSIPLLYFLLIIHHIVKQVNRAAKFLVNQMQLKSLYRPTQLCLTTPYHHTVHPTHCQNTCTHNSCITI